LDTTLDKLIKDWDLVMPAPRGLASVTRPVARRLSSLTNARGAFLDNSKDNAATLLQELGKLLHAEFGTAEPTFFSKPLHTRIAPESQIGEAARMEFAVIAIGD
jgi:hypothetical protein